MMRKRFWSIPAVLIIAFGIFLLVAYWFSEQDHLVHYRSTCQSNLKQIELVIFMYSQDYDQKLPPAIIGDKSVEWAEALSPYIENMQMFQCPSEKNEWQRKPNILGFTDYWLNKNVAERELQNFTDKTQTILSGDGDGGSPASIASYNINELPTAGLFSLNSPAKRHLSGANYAFVDGHVKWLKPEQVSQLPISRKHPVYTFSIR